MMENGMGIQPTYNLAERDDGFGNGGGWWIWILLIFVLLDMEDMATKPNK